MMDNTMIDESKKEALNAFNDIQNKTFDEFLELKALEHLAFVRNWKVEYTWSGEADNLKITLFAKDKTFKHSVSNLELVAIDKLTKYTANLILLRKVVSQALE